MAETLREQIEEWAAWDGLPKWVRGDFQKALTLPDTVQPEDVREAVQANVRDLFEQWWSELTLRGDPGRRPYLTRDAFEAGYNAALTTAPEVTGEDQT